jgi:hypothetical protein
MPGSLTQTYYRGHSDCVKARACTTHELTAERDGSMKLDGDQQPANDG